MPMSSGQVPGIERHNDKPGGNGHRPNLFRISRISKGVCINVGERKTTDWKGKSFPFKVFSWGGRDEEERGAGRAKRWGGPHWLSEISNRHCWSAQQPMRGTEPGKSWRLSLDLWLAVASPKISPNCDAADPVHRTLELLHKTMELWKTSNSHNF